MSSDLELPVIDHIKELRKRIIISVVAIAIGFVVSFYFYTSLVTILSRPFLDIESALGQKKLFYHSVFEPFLIKFKISALFGLILSVPVLFFNIIRFVFPALHSKEKKVIIIFIFFSTLLIVAGAYYSYAIIIPLMIQFLGSSTFIQKDASFLLNYSSNVFYLLGFIFYSIVVFQMPLLLEILMFLDVVSRSFLLKHSRIIVVFIFILAAFLTPPDPASQIGVGVPLLFLFFSSIFVAKLFRFGER